MIYARLGEPTTLLADEIRIGLTRLPRLKCREIILRTV
jgi:hypothetical protein